MLPLYRLYLLRVMFALIGLWQGTITWSAILHHSHPWIFWHGVTMSLLGAFTLLSLLGIRYPVKMLPLLFFEVVWKLIWVLAAWLPLWTAHRPRRRTPPVTSGASSRAWLSCRSCCRGATFGNTTWLRRETAGGNLAREPPRRACDCNHVAIVSRSSSSFRIPNSRLNQRRLICYSGEESDSLCDLHFMDRADNLRPLELVPRGWVNLKYRL